MPKDSDDHWANACWSAGFKTGFGVAWALDLLTFFGLWLWWWLSS